LVRPTIGAAFFGAVVAGALIPAPSFTPESDEPPGNVAVQVAVKAADRGGVPYGRPGMVIGRDPLTGELRTPTPQEVQTMTALTPGLLMNRSAAGLQQVLKPDGSVELDLHGRFRSFALAKIAQDGSVVTGCVTTKKEAEGFRNTSPTTQKQGNDEK